MKLMKFQKSLGIDSDLIQKFAEEKDPGKLVNDLLRKHYKIGLKKGD